MRIVNQPVPKLDGMTIATGKPVYTDDIGNHHALTVKLLRSPHAFARIIRIDVEKARQLEGVECVLTYQDVPDKRFTTAGQAYPEPSPYDRLILDEYVRYVGDPVAIVAAVDERTALRALKLIKVDYQVMPPVLDFEQAEGHSTVIHPENDVQLNFDVGMDQTRNVVSTCDMGFGDVEAELQKCEVVMEQTYYTQAQAHGMMETYRTVTHLDEYGRLNVISSTQIPFHIRRILSRALDLPKSRIRVIKPRIGGGFGGKQTACSEFFPAIVTLRTGKPAKLIYGRKETFSASSSRHAMRVKVRLGADKNGIIKVIDLEGLADKGAYGEHGTAVFTLTGLKTLPLYNQTKAVRYQGKVVYTNKMPAGALRGFGATQGTFAMESAVNELAVRLKLDPSVIREINMIKEGESNPILEGAIEGQKVVVNSCSLDKCIARGRELIGWADKYPSRKVGDGKVRGVGMAITMQGSGIAGVDTASAIIKLNDDGFYNLLIGAADMGTGCDTILAQMAAEALDTTLDKISVHAADTDISPYDTGSYASSTTYVTGNAVIKAAEALREQIVENGARLLGVSQGMASEEVVFDGTWISTADGSKKLSLDELAQRLATGEGKTQLVGTGSFGGETSPAPYIAGFAEVEVDTGTGKVEVLNYVAVVDCGTVINPNLARIQTEGGLAQGIGLALFEDVKYSPKGRLQSDSFMQYKIPCRQDIGRITVAFEPSYEPTGPFGAKSIGEVVINTPAPAIASAVYNAVGVNIRSLPITPEKVLTALQAKD